jgi:hypothetical protein
MSSGGVTIGNFQTRHTWLMGQRATQQKASHLQPKSQITGHIMGTPTE